MSGEKRRVTAERRGSVRDLSAAGKGFVTVDFDAEPPPPPLPGQPLAAVYRERPLATPGGAVLVFCGPTYECSLDGASIHVRKGTWHVGFPLEGCTWVYA